MTGSEREASTTSNRRSLIGSIAVALPLAWAIFAIVRAAEPPVTLLLSLLFNRFVEQAHLDAAPLPTKIIWGSSVNLCIVAIGLIWAGTSLGVLLFHSSQKPNA